MKSQFLFLFIFISTFTAVFAEPKEAEDKQKPGKEDAPQEKVETSAPLKYETGTVTIDPRRVSISLKRTNLQILKQLKSSLINSDLKENYQKLMKSYIDATILLQNRKYKKSRRAFESNHSELNQAAREVLKKNKDSYQELFSDVSQTVFARKVDSPRRDRFVALLERKLKIATNISLKAGKEEQKNDHLSAIQLYKKAKFRLIKILQAVKKKDTEGLSNLEKAKQGLLLEDDYVPQKYLKDYDDARGNIFVEKEKMREKRKTYVKKSIRYKYGELDFLKDTDSGKEAPEIDPTGPSAPGERETDADNQIEEQK